MLHNYLTGAYIPHNTFLLHAHTALAAKVQAHHLVRWIMPLEPADKLDPALLRLPMTDSAEHVELDVVLSNTSSGDQEAARLRQELPSPSEVPPLSRRWH